jgi:hypothetical protein
MVVLNATIHQAKKTDLFDCPPQEGPPERFMHQQSRSLLLAVLHFDGGDRATPLFYTLHVLPVYVV